ncbi:AAA family ATPase [Apiospora arundinis]|uniref:AAA family ATPase n=1 Tax=Apiospora arundinis TaxID=335852 RepID=A0ABR2I934_9PEZI
MAPEPVQRVPSPMSKHFDKEGNVAALDKEPDVTISDDNKADAIVGEAINLPDEAEDVRKLSERVRKMQWLHNHKVILEQERAEGTLATRSKQAVLYFTYAELRIEELEKELNNLKQVVYDLPEDFEKLKTRDLHPVYQHLLQRSSPSQFRLNRSSFEVPREKRAALEVLMVEHIEKKQPHEQLETNSRSTNDGCDHQANVYWSPERLRVRSRPLISHLQTATATQISHHLSVPPLQDEEETSTVFLRPFKLLVESETAIRQSIGDVEVALQKQKQERQGQDQNKPNAVSSALKRPTEETNFDYKDLLEDLKVLIKCMDEEFKPTFDLRNCIGDGTAEIIAYADLWHLFHRGDFVLLQSDPTRAYKVLQFTGGREQLIDQLDPKGVKEKTVEGFCVDCLCVESDGSSYVPILKTVSILPYPGRRPIKSLEVYPMKFDPDEAAKRESFMEQGRKYMELTTQPYVHKNVVGKTVDEPSYELDAQVIIDMTLAIHSNPDWKPDSKISIEDLTQFDKRETQITPYCFHNRFNEGCCGSDYAFKDLEMDQIQLNAFAQENGRLFASRTAEELTGEELMLLPNWVYGFVLRTRRWAAVRLADLSEVKFENDFKNLMVSPEYKSTIQALVETHESSRDGGSIGVASPSGSGTAGSVGSSIDLVRGKGTGLILLLHGAPGVGKTSTAECVADTTRRPLFPVTCGDIGETAMEVETNLQHNFRLAHKWGCVLLLDEADVFLAKRTRHDIRHNAITSVFLRSLEYYAGILFLTTNRVGHIDPAFRSRINLSLLYQPFNLKSTTRLYKIFIKRTNEEQKKRGPAHFRINRDEILDFAKENYLDMKAERLSVWNGRQIRNAFQAAISLAEHEYQKKLVNGRYPAKKPLPELGRAQLSTVADRSKEFDRYLLETIGKDEADMAYEEQARADQFALNSRGGQRKKAHGGYGMTTSSSAHARGGGGGAAARKNGKSAGNEPAVTDSEEEDDGLSSSEDDDDDEEEDNSNGDKETEEPEDAEDDKSEASDSDMEEKQMKALLAKMLQKEKDKKKKKTGKK